MLHGTDVWYGWTTCIEDKGSCVHHYWFNHEKKVTLFGLKLLGFFLLLLLILMMLFILLYCFALLLLLFFN